MKLNSSRIKISESLRNKDYTALLSQFINENIFLETALSSLHYRQE